MEKANIIETLENFGLTDKQAKVYLASLELGAETVMQISKRSGVDRIHCYYLLDQLTEKGLVSESQKGTKKVFLASDPRRVLAIQKERVRNFSESLPELMALTNIWEKKPKIQIFEGKDGLAQILEDELATMQKMPISQREILEIVSADHALSSLPSVQKSFIDRRIKYKIPLRWIATDTALGRAYASEAKSKKFYREMRLVSVDRFNFATEINIYGNKISLLGEKGQEIGIIIEHPEMAQTFREFFELAWAGAKALEKSN